ncbi:nucleoside-diphosphate kinase [Alphaproteobacteria bacterium]|nr:nucleoside-diphosphate kinase [Alphaproteobacteria bacterium]
MFTEKTLSIIKPDATARNITGQINSIIEKSGLQIIAQKKIKLTKDIASKFYEVHKDRPFFKDLVSFMISGPVVVQVLRSENAVENYRKIMGATNPEEADPGTIRKEFAESIEANSVHGSDSIENAKREIAFFFSETEIFDD